MLVNNVCYQNVLVYERLLGLRISLLCHQFVTLILNHLLVSHCWPDTFERTQILLTVSQSQLIQTFHASKPVAPCTACGHSLCVQALAISVCVPACTLKTDYATGPKRPSLLCLYAYNGTIYAPQPALPTTIALEPLFSDLHPEDCFAPQPVTSKTVASVHPWAYYSTCSSSPGQTG